MGCDLAATTTSHEHPSMRDPWRAAANWGDGTVLAVLTATHGPAYRNAGAAMAIAADGRFAGAITSGCVEADLILRASSLRSGAIAEHLRYGHGSPFFDLRLPCGGAVEILLFLVRDFNVLERLAQARKKRRPVSLGISPHGRLSLHEWRPTAAGAYSLRLGFRPPLRLLIFGTGAEASVFSSLARAMGYDHMLVSHEESSLTATKSAGSPTQLLTSTTQIRELGADADTAVILFYHDHDHEIEILRYFLGTSAFYIGAQGSRRAQQTRLARLSALGVEFAALERIHGPVGLIPSSRDPRTLAVSVLAEIIQVYDATQM